MIAILAGPLRRHDVDVDEAKRSFIGQRFTEYLNSGRRALGVYFVDEITRVVPECVSVVFLEGVNRKRRDADLFPVERPRAKQKVFHV